jgi:hypothetical protein
VAASILFRDQAAAVADDAFADPEVRRDLDLHAVLAAVTATAANPAAVVEVFRMPLRDIDDVRYRHEVFADLARAQMRAPLDAFATAMAAVRSRQAVAAKLFHPRQQQRWQLDAVQAYCTAVSDLAEGMAVAAPQSRALCAFADRLHAELAEGGVFTRLRAETDAIVDELAQVRYTVHVTDEQIRVDRDGGIADFAAEAAAVFERFTGPVPTPPAPTPPAGGMNAVEEHIVDAVASLFPRVFERLAAFCEQHAEFVDPQVAAFERDLGFYLSYLGFMTGLTELGIAFCLPELASAPEDDRAADIEVVDAAESSLALRRLRASRAAAEKQSAPRSNRVVRNGFRMVGKERILVVTGPNQSGRTTFARMVGQLFFLAAHGCPVPARAAKLFLADRIFTNFERRERLSTPYGRLDEELVRVRDVLGAAGRRSVILMNESFSSTSAADAVEIGREVVGRIADLGAVTVYVTSHEELAGEHSATVSVVGGVLADDPTRRTFRFQRRPADGLAYADALAHRYGLSYPEVRRRVGT